MWSILRSLTANQSVPTAWIITDNGKNIVSQKQDADGFVRLYLYVNNLKSQKHKRRTKKTFNSRLRSEVVEPVVCQGITTDKIKESPRNIYPTKAARPDKIHQRFLHHLGPVSISLLASVFNKSWAETKVPQEWRVADIRPVPIGGKHLHKMESYRSTSLTSTPGKSMERLVTNRLRYFAKSMHLLTKYQAWLRHGRSTEDQLLRLSQCIMEVLQQSPMQRTAVALINLPRCAVDPSVAVQLTDLGDIWWSKKPNCDHETRRPIVIGPVAAPFLHRRPGISGWSSTS